MEDLTLNDEARELTGRPNQKAMNKLMGWLTHSRDADTRRRERVQGAREERRASNRATAAPRDIQVQGDALWEDAADRRSDQGLQEGVLRQVVPPSKPGGRKRLVFVRLY